MKKIITLCICFFLVACGQANLEKTEVIKDLSPDDVILTDSVSVEEDFNNEIIEVVEDQGFKEEDLFLKEEEEILEFKKPLNVYKKLAFSSSSIKNIVQKKHCDSSGKNCVYYDCLSTLYGEKYLSGDILSTLIIDPSVKENVKLKKYDPSYVSQLQDIIDVELEKKYGNNKQFYGYYLCSVDSVTDVVIGRLYDDQTNVELYKGEAFNNIFFVVNNQNTFIYEDVYTHHLSFSDRDDFVIYGEPSLAQNNFILQWCILDICTEFSLLGGEPKNFLSLETMQEIYKQQHRLYKENQKLDS